MEELARDVNRCCGLLRPFYITPTQSWHARSSEVKEKEHVTHNFDRCGLPGDIVRCNRPSVSAAAERRIDARGCSFVTCKDSIGKIQESIQRERYCGPNPLPVRKELNELRLAAEKVYGAALERKGKAERIRSSLSLMGRNDDLFALPGKIKSNIAKGNFAGASARRKRGTVAVR